MMNDEITKLIDKSAHMKTALGRIGTRHEYPTDQKSQILLAYHSIMAEHHSAIFLLVQNDLIGSAFSLVRPIYELLYRTHWVVACASDKHIKGIFAGKDVFPKMRDLVTEIDIAYGTGDFWQTIKNDVWTPMNDYTHSGIRQIGRRFTNNQVLQNYDNGEIIEVLNGVNVALILTAHVFFHHFKKPDVCKEVEDVFNSYVSRN
jgi:hypothetical protein